MRTLLSLVNLFLIFDQWGCGQNLIMHAALEALPGLWRSETYLQHMVENSRFDEAIALAGRMADPYQPQGLQ